MRGENAKRVYRVNDRASLRGEVLLYRAEDGQPAMEVVLDRETVWLSLNQIAELFGRDKSVISRHLKNVYETRELSRKATVAKNATVQKEAGRQVRRIVEYYNLDAILSVGYRVNSKRGTQFRIWATQTLKEHLVRGYTLNRQRFEQNAQELETALQLVRKAAAGEALTTDQGRGLVDVIARYTQTFLLLQRYDEGLLTEPKGTLGGVYSARDEYACRGRARVMSGYQSRPEGPSPQSSTLSPIFTQSRITVLPHPSVLGPPSSVLPA